MKLGKHILPVLASLIGLSVLAYAQTAGNSVIFTSKGDITFPFTAPTKSGTAGTIDNMVIGLGTPRAGIFTTITATAGGVQTATSITGVAATFPITGLSAAQGGSVQTKGGTSTTTGNAGGAALVTGGNPGATGVGGAASVAGGIGGSTSGTGGAASLTGGAGTAGNAVGGAGAVTGGAGQGTGTGGVASLIGGASGAGATGNGAQARATGGAALSTNGNGGSVILAGGAKTGSGVAGMVIKRSVELVAQGAPAAKTTSATLTAAEVLTGIITVNQGAAGASAQQLPAATDMDTAMPDAAAGDAFDFSVINISTVAAEDASITTNTGWTLVGNMDVASNAAATDKSAGRFRARKTGTGAWVLYRLS